MKEQKKLFDLIAKLDTEGDIILGVEKNGEGRIRVTIQTPNHGINSQLQENLRRMLPEGATVSGTDISFDVEMENDRYDIELGRSSILRLKEKDGKIVPADERIEVGPDGEIDLPTKMYAAIKTRLAQKTDFDPIFSDAILSAPEEERRESAVSQIGRTDVHNHLAGMLNPNTLIALGIRHDVDYDLFLIAKYDIDLTPELQRQILGQIARKKGEDLEKKPLISDELASKIKNGEATEEEIKEAYENILTLAKNGKINKDFLHDEIGIPLNEVILIPGNLEKISLSMRIPVEGQAVFTNLEEVYDARDPFTKGNGRKPSLGACEDKFHLDRDDFFADRPKDDDKAKKKNAANREKLAKIKEERKKAKEKLGDPKVLRTKSMREIIEGIEGMDSFAAREVLGELTRIEQVHSEIRESEIGGQEMEERFSEGLQEDMHLMIADDARRGGVDYIETSQATLAKHAGKSGPFLEAMTGKVSGTDRSPMDYIQEQMGVTIKYLAAIRRNFDFQRDFDSSTGFVIDSAALECCAGVDFMGEELNETAHFSETITNLARYAIDHDSDFVIRVHAGENNANSKNIEQVIDAVDEAFIARYVDTYKEVYGDTGKSDDEIRQEILGDDGKKLDFVKAQKRLDELKKTDSRFDIKYPQIRIGHGLYGPIDNKDVMRRMAERGVIVEFNITSNVRLNNLAPEEVLSTFKKLIDAYSSEKTENGNGIGIVFGTDGYGIYGTTTRDEIEYLSQVLKLSTEQIERVMQTEQKIMDQSERRVPHKASPEEKKQYTHTDEGKSGRIDIEKTFEKDSEGRGIQERVGSKLDPKDPFEGKKPIVIAGGSFFTHEHIEDSPETEDVARREGRLGELRERRKKSIEGLTEEDKAFIDHLIEEADPEEVCFVVGHTGMAQEGYLLQRLKELKKENPKKVFKVVAVMPSNVRGVTIGKGEDAETVYPYQNQTEERDLLEVFDLADDDIITGIVTKGASKEGTSIYKVLDGEVFTREGATMVAFDGDAPLGNAIREAIDRGVDVFARDNLIPSRFSSASDKVDMFNAVSSSEFDYRDIKDDDREYLDSFAKRQIKAAEEKERIELNAYNGIGKNKTVIQAVNDSNTLEMLEADRASQLYSKYFIQSPNLMSLIADFSRSGDEYNYRIANTMHSTNSTIKTVKESLGTEENKSGTKGKLEMFGIDAVVDEVTEGTRTTGAETRRIVQVILKNARGNDKEKDTAEEKNQREDDDGKI